MNGAFRLRVKWTGRNPGLQCSAGSAGLSGNSTSLFNRRMPPFRLWPFSHDSRMALQADPCKVSVGGIQTDRGAGWR